MKKHRKKILTLLAFIFSLAVVVGAIWGAVYATAPPNKNKAQKVFKKDYKLINTVVFYLENNGNESLYIHKAMSINEKHVKIEDEEVMDAIDQLFEKRGYDVVIRDGNTISFQRWTRMNFGSGIVYSINKEDEPVLQYLTKLEPLSEDGWYYYEEDYNKARTQ